MPQLTVRFWFDPSCPYTWLVSRWMREVEQVRPVRVVWQIMSLSILNEDRDDDPEDDPDGFLWGPARLFAAVQHQYGAEAVGRLYDRYGVMAHGGVWGPVETVLTAAGLPADLATAWHSPEHDEVLRASHTAGVSRIGDHVGTPITLVEPEAGRPIVWFGPVLSRVPQGEAAGRLWDGTLLVAEADGFHELKGRRHQPPVW
ncbi:mycothiol-dependent nitroreductase Rv2466c family protein [Micromonospora palythoicola]|uniref:mycothiol-dependent nitroreductase Rv2466c family protein n=1 Tax=Micromonospora palythoicola TaxID=3120507 RepID=UPI002FCE18BA